MACGVYDLLRFLLGKPVIIQKHLEAKNFVDRDPELLSGNVEHLYADVGTDGYRIFGI